MASTDHMPISVMLNVESLPELTMKDTHPYAGQVEWSKLTQSNLQQSRLTEKNPGKIQIPYDAILCCDINCANPDHNNDLCTMYGKILNGINNASKTFYDKRAKRQTVRPGCNWHVSKLQQQAREAFKNWVT